MKRIPLNVITVPARNGQPEVRIAYDEVVREVLYAGGRQGLPTRALLLSDDVWSVVRSAQGRPFVLLEDAHYKHLMARLDVFTWGSGSEGAAKFCRDLEAAETVDPNAPTPKGGE